MAKTLDSYHGDPSSIPTSVPLIWGFFPRLSEDYPFHLLPNSFPKALSALISLHFYFILL